MAKHVAHGAEVYVNFDGPLCVLGYGADEGMAPKPSRSIESCAGCGSREIERRRGGDRCAHCGGSRN